MPESLKNLINMISFLPWIWEKSATKLAFFLLHSNKNYLENFREALVDIKENIWYCAKCHCLLDKWKKLCNICSDENRNQNSIIIVEEYLDMLSIEQTWAYKGTYHILWWAISPVNWVFVWDLNFESLFKRIENSDNKVEIILATNPNIEWEATSSYIKEEISSRALKHKTKITRLSRWLSAWYIEYADNMTLISAIKERKEI
jgi:recombination protein RecR